MVCNDRVNDKYFPTYFRCGWCDNCKEYARQKLKDKFIEADFDFHIILTLRNKPQFPVVDEVRLYNELLYMLEGFKGELRKRLKYKWEFWAIPHIEYDSRNSTWNPHIHSLFRGLRNEDLHVVRQVWRKTKGNILANDRGEEGAVVVIKKQMNPVQKDNTARYVANKFRLLKIGDRKRLYKKTAGYYKMKTLGDESQKTHHLQKKSLLGLIKACRKLLKPGEVKRLEMKDFKKKLRQKHEGRLWGSKGHVAQLIAMGFIGRKIDPEYRKGYLYWLQPETEYSLELVSILDET
jgi:hypothetical protein